MKVRKSHRVKAREIKKENELRNFKITIPLSSRTVGRCE